MKIELTDFVKRQWKPDFSGTKMASIDQGAFISDINNIPSYFKFDGRDIETEEFSVEVHPEWDFCKYLFIRIDSNARFEEIRVASVKINHTLLPYIRTSYSSRTPDELPILTRFLQIPKEANYRLPYASYIGCVLYSREQLLKEYEAETKKELAKDNIVFDEQIKKFELSEDCEYGIVAIMGLHEPQMEPMLPITHMRNALAESEGGNGQKLNKAEYLRSVKYWSEYILIK